MSPSSPLIYGIVIILVVLAAVSGYFDMYLLKHGIEFSREVSRLPASQGYLLSVAALGWLALFPTSILGLYSTVERKPLKLVRYACESIVRFPSESDDE